MCSNFTSKVLICKILPQISLEKEHLIKFCKSSEAALSEVCALQVLLFPITYVAKINRYLPTANAMILYKIGHKTVNKIILVIPSTGGNEFFGNPFRPEFPAELLPDNVDVPALLTGEPGLSLYKHPLITFTLCISILYIQILSSLTLSFCLTDCLAAKIFSNCTPTNGKYNLIPVLTLQ